MEVVGGVAILEIEVLHDGIRAKAVGVGDGKIGAETTYDKVGYKGIEGKGAVGTEAVEMPVKVALQFVVEGIVEYAVGHIDVAVP